MYKRVLLIVSLALFLLSEGTAQNQFNSETTNSRIDSYLNNSVENGYSGSVLVAKNGKILLSKAYGWADRNKKIPNEPNTIFNIGSVTKQFTAAAILKLQEQDKLKTSDKISKYFPQVSDDKRNITIHQLLTHASGIPPQTGGFRYDEASKQKFIEDFSHAELMYPPGTKYTYANANYILLAAIIEEVSKQDYESFLREKFWNPLQMNNTGYKRKPNANVQLAYGYYFNYTDGKWEDWGTTPEHLPQNSNHWYSIGKGDIYSTTEDLFKWLLALEQNTVLSADSKRLMETAYIPENKGKTSFYGYGWAIFNSENNTKIVTHNGSNGIYFADFIRYVDEDLVIISLSNVILNPQSENVAWEIASMLHDKNYQAQPIPKNSYELVFDFMRSNTPEQVNQIPQFFKEKTGRILDDKAVLNRIGFKQVSEKLDSNWGVALLKQNVKLFPDDGNLWDSLGEAYYLLDDKKNAIKSFEEALKLKPEENCYWCENSTTRLNQLKQKK